MGFRSVIRHMSLQLDTAVRPSRREYTRNGAMDQQFVSIERCRDAATTCALTN